MIYGLYLSASGVLTNSFRQDVIANNLANAETVGFKRSLALAQQRRTEAETLGQFGSTHPELENIGGGVLLAPIFVDQTQGSLESSNNNLDVAIHGRGFFAIQDGTETRLTRNGQFMIDRTGHLVMSDGTGRRVLDNKNKPISLAGIPKSKLEIGPDGSISADNQVVGQIGLFDVTDERQLQQLGGTLLNHPDIKNLRPATGTIQSGYIENSNADPTTELTQLINVQRQLEANANMIRYQDQTLGRLVNEVGKIG